MRPNDTIALSGLYQPTVTYKAMPPIVATPPMTMYLSVVKRK